MRIGSIGQGTAQAKTLAQVGDEADVVLTMVATPEAVREVALGLQGFFPHLKLGALWVDCSTVNPSFSRQMAQTASERQVRSFGHLPVPAALLRT